MYKINLGKLKQVINLIISNKKYVEKDVIRMLRFIAKRRGGGGDQDKYEKIQSCQNVKARCNYSNLERNVHICIYINMQ